MGQHYKIDSVAQKIIITSKNALSEDEQLHIADFQQKGYTTEVKPNKRAQTSRGKNKEYYKGVLTEEQFKTFESAIKNDGFFKARKWAEEQLKQNE